MEYHLSGLALEVSPTTLTVPRGISTQVNTSVTGADALPNTAAVYATLRGPSFPGTIEIKATPNQPIYLPPLSQPGTHFLEDIRLQVNDDISIAANPSDVTINVLNELLVSNLTSRPLSLDEIRERGIEFDENSFKAFKFTFAMTLESEVVEIDLPVLIPLPGTGKEPRIISEGLGFGGGLHLEGLNLPSFTIEPIMLEVFKEVEGEDIPSIPGLLIIPGNVAFLNQFFSVMLVVSNEAPDGTPLVVRDMQAEVFLPPGADGVVGDIVGDPPFAPGDPEYDNPLRIAKTAAGRESIKPVLAAGADGQAGTADDIDQLVPQDSGSAEFLVEGVHEGSHVIDAEIRGVLDGLPSGPVEVVGRARGAVVVRDPDFSLTFIHPNIVRAGELYELNVQLHNTSQVDGNLVTVSLDERNLTGARFLDPADATQTIETIPAGDSASVTFRFEALATGQVNATTLEIDDEIGAVSGRRIILKAGVSEQGVPLSPDTLLLPPSIGTLRERAANNDLIFRAMALLGQAHSIATAPRGSLPVGVRFINSQTVIQRARELSEAAVRLEYSLQPASDGSPVEIPGGLLLTLQDLYFDWLGAGVADSGWDVLYRDSRQARLFGVALAEVLGREVSTLGYVDLIDLQHSWADTESYRDPHFTIMTQSPGSALPVVFDVVDSAGQRLGGSLDPESAQYDLLGADTLVFTEGDTPVGQFTVVTQPTSLSYRTTIRATQTGSFDLALVAEAGDGELHQYVYRGLSVTAGDELNVSVLPGLGAPVSLERNNTIVAPTAEEVIADGPPEVLAVVQDADYNIDMFGRVVAVLFDEEVDEASAQDAAAYAVSSATIAMLPPPDLIDTNGIRAAARQFGDRIVYVGLRDPIGPFVPRALSISGVQDSEGRLMAPVVDKPILPDPDIDEGGQVTGRILRADGTPALNAEVSYIVVQPPLCIGEAVISTKTADAEGAYNFDFVVRESCEGPFTIRARDLDTGEEGRLTTKLRADGQRLTMDIVLVGRGAVEGIVRNAEGATIANADVKIKSATDGSAYNTRTDQNGFYRVEGVPVGPAGIRVTSDIGTALVSSFIAASGAVEVNNVTVFSNTIVGVVTGEVRFPDGSPAADVEVFLGAEDALTAAGISTFLDGTRTDTAGTFRLEDIPTGNYRVRARDKAAGFIGDALLAVTDLNGPDNPAFVRIVLNGTGSVAGTIYERVGDNYVPAPGALVAGGFEVVTTDAQGNYFIPAVPVGISTIKAGNPETGEQGNTPVTILSSGQQSHGIDVYLDPLGTISGRVYDPAGQPVAYQEVKLIVHDIFVRSVETDGQGYYSFDHLDLIDYPLTVVRGKEVANGDGRLSAQVLEDVVDLHLVRPTGRVSGRVIDETGLEVAAKVELRAMVPNVVGQLKFKNAATIISDPVRGFEFDKLFPGPFSVTATSFFAPEGATITGLLPASIPVVENITLVLAKNTATLSGCVLTPDGEFIEPVLDDQRVPLPLTVFITSGQLRSELDSAQNPEPDGIRVDGSSGCYVSSIPLPPDIYTVQVTDQRPGSSTFGLTGQAMIYLDKGEDAILDVSLLGLGTLGVEVVDSSGQAVPGVQVRVNRETYPNDVRETLLTTPTDVTPGLFTDLTEGPVVVSAVVSSDPAVDVGGREDLRGFGGTVAGEVARDGVQVVRVVVDAAGNVMGRFLRTDGVTPVSNAQVRLIAPKQPTAFDVTDADGAFSFSGIPVGAFDLVGFDAFTGRYGEAQGHLEVDGQTVTIDFELGPLGRVTGTVLDANGAEPVGGATVKLENLLKGLDREVTSDAAGDFIFESVPGGAFNITAVSLMGLSGQTEGVLSAEGEVVDVEVVLQGSGMVEGTVYDAFGEPAVAADVTLIDAVDRQHVAQTGIDGVEAGRFVIENVPVGSFTLEARPANALTPGDGGRTEGSVVYDDETVSLDVHFEGTVTVGVTVLNTSGTNPVAVTLESDGQFGGRAAPTTIEGGVYLFEAVPRAPLTVTAKQETPIGTMASSMTSLTLDDLPLAGERLVPDIELVLSERAIIGGRVMDSASVPVASAKVSLQAGSVNALAISQADGSFEFNGVPLTVDVMLRADVTNQGIALFSGRVDGDGVLRDASDTPVDELILVVDDEAPSVTEVSPPQGATAVTTTTNVVVTFSEAIDPDSVTACDGSGPNESPTFRLLEVSGDIVAANDAFDLCDDSNVVPIASALSSDGRTVTLTPAGELQGLTQHTVVVSAGEVDDIGMVVGGARDLVGQVMVDAFVSNFVTRDNVPPTITDISPEDGASNVSGKSVVRITFSEPVAGQSFDESTLIVEGPLGPVTGQRDLILGNTVAVFTPTDASGNREFFVPNATYSIRLTGVVDPAGNVQLPQDEVLVSFRTRDTVPPVISAVTAPPTAPAGGSVLIAATTANPDVATVEFFVDGVLTVSTSQPSTPGEYQSMLVMPDTSIDVAARAIDTSGNVGEMSVPVTINVLPDNTPTATITSPLPDTIVSPGSTVQFVVSATDDVGITNVKGAVSGVVTSVTTKSVTPSTQTAEVSFDVEVPLQIAGGNLTFAAVVTDSRGQQSVTASLTLIVSDTTPPTVNLMAPAAETEYLSGSLVLMQAVANDEGGISRVEFLVDGAVVATDNVTPYSAEVPIDVAAGMHDVVLAAAAYDLSDNRAESSSVTIHVINDIGPPTVDILSPANDSAFVEETSVSVAVSASDDLGVNRVEFDIDGVPFAIDDSAPYAMNFTMPPRAQTDTVQVTATAFDTVGGSASDTINVRVLADQPPTIILTQAPEDGAQVAEESTVHLEVSATDDVSVAAVDLLLDGAVIQIDDTTPFAFDFEVPLFASVTNPIEITLVARDGKDQTTSTPPLHLNVVELDLVPPAVDQIEPLDGATDVSVNSVIIVRFTEPLAADSVVAGVVRLLQQGIEVSGGTTLSDDALSITFKPDGLLAGFTDYNIEVVGVTDDVGNRMDVLFVSTFTTGQFVDTERPTVIRTNPSNNQTGVPVNAPVSVEFSERIDPATLTPISFSVLDDFTGLNVGGMIQVNADGRTASFVPGQSFGIDRSYTVTLNTTITDAAGNSLIGPVLFTFVTAFSEDIRAPQIIDITPADGAVEVPLNAVVAVQFNEPVDSINVLRGIVVLDAGVPVNGSIALSDGNRRATFTPAVTFVANTFYTIIVMEAVTDVAGNALSIPATYTFETATTSDTTRPSVTAVMPPNSATDVPTNVVVQVAFGERINPLTVNSTTFYVRDVSTNTHVLGDIAVAADGLSAVFTPSLPLYAGTWYEVRASGIEDLAGNGLSLTVSSYFTTGLGSDNIAPSVVQTSISNGQVGVPINGQVVIQLDEPVDAFSAEGAVVVTVDGVPVNGTVGVSADGLRVTFTPSAALATDTIYVVTVVGLTDRAGNPLGLYDTTFTTSSDPQPDTAGPMVLSVSPINGAIAVGVNTSIVWTFNEVIDPTTVNASSMRVRIPSLSYAVVAGDYTVAGAVVTFTPLTPLPAIVQLEAGVYLGVKDLAGNGSLLSTTYFTTGATLDTTPPQIVSVTPSDGTTDIGPNTKIVLSFSESLNPDTVNSSNFGLFANGDWLGYSVSRSADNRTVMLSTTLPADSVVIVVVTDGVEDLSGNRLADFASHFITAPSFDVDRPRVVTQRPNSGANDVTVDASVVLYVDESLNEATIPGALYIAQDGVPVNGTIQVSGDGRTIEFIPDLPWAYGAYIEVFLDEAAADLVGNTLYSYQGSFATLADPRTNPPHVVATQPGYNAVVPRNVVIEVAFSEALDPVTVNEVTVGLYDVTDGVWVDGGTLSLERGGQVIRGVPAPPLLANHSYYAEIDGVQDLDGEAAEYLSQWFSTNDVVDTVAPSVMSVSPPDGADSVGVNARIRVRFDEPINPLTVNTATVQVMDGGSSVAASSISFSSDNHEVVLVPHAPLADATVYTVTVSGVEDAAGNAVSAPSTTFTTGVGPDTQTPTVVRHTPINGATDVPVNAVVVLEVDEPIDPSTVHGQSLRVRDETTSEVVAGSYGVSADGRVISFAPDVPLAIGHTHWVGFNRDGIEDLSGNLLTGTEFFFTTAFAEDLTAPQVVEISPADGLGEVPTNVQMMVQFDEPVETLSVDNITVRAGVAEVAVKRALSDGNRVVTLSPLMPLNALTEYTVTIEAVIDLSGNPLLAPVFASFITESGADLVKPEVTAVEPPNSATDVPTNVVVQVAFSERINPLTVNSTTFYVRDVSTNTHVLGDIAVAADGLSAVFTPSLPLYAGTWYEVRASGIEDLAGNSLNMSTSRFVTW